MKAKLQALKKFGSHVAAAVVIGGMTAAANAQASAPDFTSVTSAIDFSTVITAILAVAGIMAGVYVAFRGAKFALRALKGL